MLENTEDILQESEKTADLLCEFLNLNKIDPKIGMIAMFAVIKNLCDRSVIDKEDIQKCWNLLMVEK